MHDVADLVDQIGAGRAERVWHELEIRALFDRCRSLHRATLLLLEQGFVHEAVMLDRPLFTDSLALAELAAADDERRGSLFVGWALGGLQQLMGYFLDRRSRGHEVAGELEALAERKREVEKYARDHGYSTKHWQPDDDAKRLADAHGRGSEYGAMLVTGMFVHGARTATSERYLRTEEGVYVVGGPAPTPKSWERDAAVCVPFHASRSASRVPLVRIGRADRARRRAQKGRAGGPATQRFFVAASHAVSHDPPVCSGSFLSSA
jgi:hypothetical protein